MISLANKYRPQSFEEVIGQKSVVKILSKQVESDNVRNCYLFCGATGSGKTTCAKILAHAVNGGDSVPIEIDAASNNSVDNIRAIVAEAQERAVDGKYKTIILDEVHVLSSAAWQCLLKYAEDPAPLTILIMCTTEPQKIPATILNRVQRFDFSRIRTEDIMNRLVYVCNKESIPYEEAALSCISRSANGCMRAALTSLDKCIDYESSVTLASVMEVLGGYDYSVFFDLTNAMLDGDESAVLKIVDNVYDSGKDLSQFVYQFLQFNLDIIKYSLCRDCSVTSLPEAYTSSLENALNFENPTKYYNYVVDKLLELKNMLRQDTDVRSTVEVVCLQITRLQ